VGLIRRESVSRALASSPAIAARFRRFAYAPSHSSTHIQNSSRRMQTEEATAEWR